MGIIYYITSIFTGLLSIYFTAWLKKTYGQRFLNSLFHFLIVFNIHNMLNWVSIKIIRMMFAGKTETEIKHIYYFFGLFSFPLIPLVIYFIFKTLVQFIEKEVPRPLSMILIAIYLVFVSTHFIITAEAFSKNDFTLYNTYSRVNNSIGIFIFVSIPLPFLVQSLRQREEFKRRWWTGFIVIWWALTLLIYLSPLSWLQIRVASTRIDLLTFLFFAGPLLPLWYLHAFLKKQMRCFTKAKIAAPDLDAFCRKYSLSKREHEVMELLFQGKSQKDIENCLFISLRTVKSHLYNIYHKTSVKNRIQLLNLIQNMQWKEEVTPVETNRSSFFL